jgi:hypothetical protein
VKGFSGEQTRQGRLQQLPSLVMTECVGTLLDVAAAKQTQASGRQEQKIGIIFELFHSLHYRDRLESVASALNWQMTSAPQKAEATGAAPNLLFRRIATFAREFWNSWPSIACLDDCCVLPANRFYT